MTVSVKVWGTFAGLSVYYVLGRLLKMRSRALSNTYLPPHYIQLLFSSILLPTT